MRAEIEPPWPRRRSQSPAPVQPPMVFVTEPVADERLAALEHEIDVLKRKIKRLEAEIARLRRSS